MPIIVNFASFQAGWFACVLGGAANMPWAGVVAVAAVIAIHAWQSPDHRPEMVLVLLAALIGATWDSLLVATGLLVYPSGQIAASIAPVWIIALWMAFATSLNVSMRWMKGRLWLAAILGGVCGPMTFWGGARLGAVEFPELGPALAALSVGWALLMPLMVMLATRFDGWHPDLSAEPVEVRT